MEKQFSQPLIKTNNYLFGHSFIYKHLFYKYFLLVCRSRYKRQNCKDMEMQFSRPYSHPQPQPRRFHKLFSFYKILIRICIDQTLYIIFKINWHRPLL